MRTLVLGASGLVGSALIRPVSTEELGQPAGAKGFAFVPTPEAVRRFADTAASDPR